jgi:TRAP-type C4-dicarboxylate transport system permease small subunit
MGNLKNIIIAVDKTILNILKFITVVIFVVITLILTANIFIRFVLPLISNFAIFMLWTKTSITISLHWLDEIIEMLFAALVFYGSAALWISKGHFSAGDWISKVIKSQRLKNLYRLILEIMVLIFLAMFLYYSFDLFMRAHDVTNALAMPKKVLYSCMPISGVIMVVYALKNVIVELIGVINPETVEELLNEKL